MVGNAGTPAGFVDEIKLLRHCQALAETGPRWLLVQADHGGRAAPTAEVTRACGATLAVSIHCRTLTVKALTP